MPSTTLDGTAAGIEDLVAHLVVESPGAPPLGVIGQVVLTAQHDIAGEVPAEALAEFTHRLARQRLVDLQRSPHPHSHVPANTMDTPTSDPLTHQPTTARPWRPKLALGCATRPDLLTAAGPIVVVGTVGLGCADQSGKLDHTPPSAGSWTFSPGERTPMVNNQLHRPHDPAEHDHVHGDGCGHRAVPHDDHLDYLHGGHWHAEHDGHYDEHPNLDH